MFLSQVSHTAEPATVIYILHHSGLISESLHLCAGIHFLECNCSIAPTEENSPISWNRIPMHRDCSRDEDTHGSWFVSYLVSEHKRAHFPLHNFRFFVMKQRMRFKTPKAQLHLLELFFLPASSFPKEDQHSHNSPGYKSDNK